MGGIPDLGIPLGNVPKGEACDQHPNHPELRGCSLQASREMGLDKFTSCAFIAPIAYVEGVHPVINRGVASVSIGGDRFEIG